VIPGRKLRLTLSEKDLKPVISADFIFIEVQHRKKATDDSWIKRAYIKYF
jgi:hypothetical protein